MRHQLHLPTTLLMPEVVARCAEDQVHAERSQTLQAAISTCKEVQAVLKLLPIAPYKRMWSCELLNHAGQPQHQEALSEHELVDLLAETIILGYPNRAHAELSTDSSRRTSPARQHAPPRLATVAFSFVVLLRRHAMPATCTAIWLRSAGLNHQQQ